MIPVKATALARVPRDALNVPAVMSKMTKRDAKVSTVRSDALF